MRPLGRLIPVFTVSTSTNAQSWDSSHRFVDDATVGIDRGVVTTAAHFGDDIS
jgi:hypothetical protein